LINVTRPARVPHIPVPSLVWVNVRKFPSLRMILEVQYKLGACFFAEYSILNETPENPEENLVPGWDVIQGMNRTRS
jgi:hypothetical protein